MNKRSLGRLWVLIVLAINVVFLAYLYTYQTAGGFVFGIPEALLSLSVFVSGVVTINSVMGWLYLGKPDLRELFVPRSSGKPSGQPSMEDD